MINWTPVTKPSGTIDLIKAFDQLLSGLGEPGHFSDYQGALRFLRNIERLTEITNTGIASIAIAQALHIYDPSRSVRGYDPSRSVRS